MKDKFLNYCKENWWKILLYILIIYFGMLLIPVLVDTKELEIFLNKFGFIAILMQWGYLLYWYFVSKLVIDFLLWVENKINNKKEQKKNKNGDENA